MPGSVKRDRRTYQTPGVVSGNLARDLTSRELERNLERSGQIDFDQRYREKHESQADKRVQQRREVKASVRAPQKVPITAVMGSIALAVVAVMVVTCQVKINAISTDIVSMKAEIAELEMEQIALQTQYEQSFDLAGVKEAAEAAGLHQPGDGQVIYIDLPGEDQAVSRLGEEQGVLARVFAVISQRIYTVLEYFS